MHLLGVDFTSAPCPRKPITVAHGRLRGSRVRLERLDALPDWACFEDLLATPGPWLGAFDFPFGLPREAVLALRWPEQWQAMVEHCARLGRELFRQQLDAYRRSRPAGRRYAHRRTDRPAGSHSPLKLVNPPVGLMFLEGAPRLLAANLSLPGIHAVDPRRVAVEAYPALLARSMVKESYKNDGRAGHSPERRAARSRLLDRMASGEHALELRLEFSAAQRESMLEDGRGDLLDAALALLQAAWAERRREAGFGLPGDVDPLEGWIVSA